MKTVVLIDGSNLNASMRAMGWQIDFAKLRELIDKRSSGFVLRMCYYTAEYADEVRRDKQAKFLDYLRYSGVKVISKPEKVYQSDFGTKCKGNMDIEICLDAVIYAKVADQVWLFSGDGDFVPLVRELQRNGVFVTVCSSRIGSVFSEDLRKVADAVVFIDELRDSIELQRVRTERVENGGSYIGNGEEDLEPARS